MSRLVVALAPKIISMGHSLLDTYQIGDARKLLSILPESEWIDTTITSPPYWNLKDYGSREQVGYGQKYDEYLDDLQKIFSAVFAITKKTGSLWVVADTIKHQGRLKLLPFDLAERLGRIGWILQDIIVWHKDKTLPWSHRGKLRNIFEYILFFSKDKHFKYYLSEVREIEGLKRWWVRYPERYSPQGKAPSRNWYIKIPRQGSWGENWVRHFCPFPPDLVRRMIRLTTRTGDVVLDPLAGSGVVLAQAKALGRHFIGFDLRKSYRRMFSRKVLPSILQLEKLSASTNKAEGKNRRSFSACIWKLRKLKYPRELIRLYQKQFGRIDLAGAVALSKKKHTLDVILIFPRGKRPPTGFSARIDKLMSRPPLSKYGLRVIVKTRIMGSKDTSLPRNGFNVTPQLSLYANGRTYGAPEQVSERDFLHLIHDRQEVRLKRMPPIVSNIHARVKQEMIPRS